MASINYEKKVLVDGSLQTGYYATMYEGGRYGFGVFENTKDFEASAPNVAIFVNILKGAAVENEGGLTISDDVTERHPDGTNVRHETILQYSITN